MYVVLQTHVGHIVPHDWGGKQRHNYGHQTQLKGGACKIAALFCLTRLSWS